MGCKFPTVLKEDNLTYFHYRDDAFQHSHRVPSGKYSTRVFFEIDLEGFDSDIRGLVSLFVRRPTASGLLLATSSFVAGELVNEHRLKF